MAIDYDRMAATARRLISENGRQIIARKLVNTPADATKPWRGAADPVGAPPVTLTLEAVQVPPSSVADLGGKFQALDELSQRASKVYIAAPPEGGPDNLDGYDEVVDTGTFRIIEVDTLRPGDTTLLFFIAVQS